MTTEKPSAKKSATSAVKQSLRFNIRISGQIEAKSEKEATAKLAALGAVALTEGGIYRITPAEGA
jgi:hypothetical protein